MNNNQPMKRNLLILFLLLSNSEAFSQQLPVGKFFPSKKSQGFDNCLFNFKKDSIEFIISGCQGRSYGIGKYIIVEDSLFIHFANQKVPSHWKLTKLEGMKSDSVVNYFKIIDEEQGGIPGVRVRAMFYPNESKKSIYNDKEMKDSVLKESWTSMSGTTKLVLKNFLGNAYLEVGSVGFGTERIPLDLSNGSMQYYEVQLSGFPTYYYQNGDVIRFKIKKVSKNKISLYKTPTNFTNYQRINNKKYVNLKSKLW
jgi:hypothetical protein